MYIDMQHEHGHAKWTRIMDMNMNIEQRHGQGGTTTWICSVDTDMAVDMDIYH